MFVWLMMMRPFYFFFVRIVMFVTMTIMRIPFFFIISFIMMIRMITNGAVN